MSKHHSVENFYIGDDFIHCYTTWTRDGFCHHAEYIRGFDMLAKKRLSYINRTWERFEYEDCIKALAEKLPRTERLAVEAFVVKHAKEVAEECDKWLDTFTAMVGKLNNEQRDTLAKTVGHIDTEEKAQAAMLMATAMAVAS